MQPRVFVGTLHSNEGDFKRCCEVIRTQVGVEVCQYVVSDMSEQAAHNALWEAWMVVRGDHDLFVKVDADTVLVSPSTLLTISQQLRDDPEATSLQAPLHDYMTDQLINGLNAYTPRVEFAGSLDSLYCDRGMTQGDTKTIRDAYLRPELVPAGYHCHLATELQGFRYGVHRAMKTQDEEIQRLIWTWRRYSDRVRGLGVIGALMAPKLMKLQAADYVDTRLMEAYEDASRRYDEYVAAINAQQFQVFE